MAPSGFPGSSDARRRLTDRAMRWLLTGVGSVTVLLLAGIFLFLAGNGLPAFGTVPAGEFLFSGAWNPSAYGEPRWGILGLLAGTLWVCAGAMAMALPFGLALAVYLSDIASKRTREILKPVVEMIAGIPSVVLGLLGLLFVAPAMATVFGLSNGLNGLTAALLVGIACVPTVASLSEDALSGISLRMREASLALGATRWTTIRRVLLPAAASGIAAAAMLGLGRAIGETIIVLMVAGNSLAFPRTPLDPVRPLTATIAIEIREVVVGDAHWGALFAIGLLLFLLTFALNCLADLFVRRRYAA